MTAKLTRSGGWTKLALMCIFFAVHLYLYFISPIPYASWMVSILVLFIFVYAYVFFSSRTIMEVTDDELKLHTLFGEVQLGMDGIERIELKQTFLNRLLNFVTIEVSFTDKAVKRYHCNQFERSKGHQFIMQHLSR